MPEISIVAHGRLGPCPMGERECPSSLHLLDMVLCARASLEASEWDYEEPTLSVTRGEEPAGIAGLGPFPIRQIVADVPRGMPDEAVEEFIVAAWPRLTGEKK